MNSNTLSTYKKKKIIQCFADGVTATEATHRLNLNRNTINKYYNKIRGIIVDYQNYEKLKLISAKNDQGFKVIYTHISKWKHDKNADNTLYIGVFEIDNKIFCDIFEKKKDNLNDLLNNYQQHKISDNSPLNLKLYAYQHLMKMIPESDKNLNTSSSQNLSQEFSQYLNTYIKKYFGVKKEQIPSFIKEVEFRFNYRNGLMEQKVMPLHSII